MTHTPSTLHRMPANRQVNAPSSRIPANGKKPIRQKVYEILVGQVTELCYWAGLNHFPENAAILDVGIGNGLMLHRYHELIKSKGFKITGIDISRDALQECARRIRTYGLEDHIDLRLASIEDFQPDCRPQFDYVFFTMSFMLLENQKMVLDRVRRMIPYDGEILFFQTLYEKKLPIMDFIKPKLKYFSGIEFGPVSYEEDFFALLQDREMTVKEDHRLQKKWFQGEYRLIVTAPATGASDR